MYEVYKNTRNYDPMLLGVVDENGNILGILLSVIQKENRGLLGKFSSRSVIACGPLIKNNDTKILDYLLTAYNKKIKRKVIYSQFRNQWTWNDKQKEIFRKYGFGYEAHLDIIHDLSKPINEQFMHMHKGRRKNIRRAERNVLEFKEIENEYEFNIALKLIKETYNRVKHPLPDISLFNSSNKLLSNKKQIRIFIAKFQSEIIAIRIVLCFNILIYDWYAGSSDKHLDKYPNDFLLWKIMEWGANNGYKYFDFGGAGKPNVHYGVRDYKMKFGGELVEFGRFEKIHNITLFSIGKIGLFLIKRI